MKDSLFQKHAKLLHSLTKHQVFRDYLGHNTLKLPQGVLPLSNGYVRRVGENTFTLHVAPANIYGKILPALKVVDFLSNRYTNLKDMQKALLYELEQIKLYSNPLGYNQKDFRLRFATFTGSPNTGGGVTTCKNCYANTADSVWATNHDATSGTVEISSVNTVLLASSGTSNRWSTLIRNFHSYDLAVMGAGATIQGSPTVRIYVTGKVETLGSQSINIYNSNAASANDVVAGDYNDAGTTAQATAIALADFTIGDFKTWTLNATGIATLETAAGSAVKFSVRLVSDATNTEPTWAATVTARLGFEMAADPSPLLLTATYTPVVTASFFAFF